MDIIQYIEKYLLRDFAWWFFTCVKEIGDGNLNFVFRAYNDQKSLIIKYAPPYLRLLGEILNFRRKEFVWKCTPYLTLKRLHPPIFLLFTTLMKKHFYLPWRIWKSLKLCKKVQLEMPIFLHVYEQLGDFLAKVYANTPPFQHGDYYENATLKHIRQKTISFAFLTLLIMFFYRNDRWLIGLRRLRNAHFYIFQP